MTVFLLTSRVFGSNFTKFTLQRKKLIGERKIYRYITELNIECELCEWSVNYGVNFIYVYLLLIMRSLSFLYPKYTLNYTKIHIITGYGVKVVKERRGCEFCEFSEFSPRKTSWLKVHKTVQNSTESSQAHLGLQAVI